MKTINTRLGAVFALALAATSWVAAARADTGTDDVRMKSIRYDDLDLNKPAGARALYRRIQAAAGTVCDLSTSNLRLLSEQQACIERAIDEAVRNVNAPALTRLRFGADVRLAGK